MTDLRQAAQQALEALEALARYENPQTRIQVRKPKDGVTIVTMYPHKVATDTANALRTALEQPEQEPVTQWTGCGECDCAFKCHNGEARCIRLQPEQEPKKLWLWKNFVDGKPEYWAFDNAFPVHLDCDDPQTLGEPCGYAIFKPSREGRTDISDGEVLLRIKKVAAQRPWVGLTDGEWMNIVNKDNAWFHRQPDEVAEEVAKLVEAKLREKNT